MPRPQGGAHADPERRPRPARRRGDPAAARARKARQDPRPAHPPEVAEALTVWRDRHHAPIFGPDEALLFPRLGSRGRDGRYPDAGGRLSGRALGFIVAATLG